MKNATIKEIGTINIDRVEVAEGQIEMRIPVEVISEQMDTTLDTLIAQFRADNPKVDQVYYEARLVFQFGRSNPEFSLTLIIFDGTEDGADEIWDELEVTLSEDAKKQFRRIAWDKLGDALFNI